MSMAERTLRERCIEAGAKAVYASKWGPSMSGPKPAGMDFHLSANVLDAIIGVLTEHADEWFDAWASREDPAFTGLLAVLEGDE